MKTLKKVSRGRKTRNKVQQGRKRKTRNKVQRGRKMRGGADDMVVGDIVTCKSFKMVRPTLPIAISDIRDGSMYSWTGSGRTMYNITDCTKVLNMADDMVPGHLVTCVKDDKTITDPFFIASNNNGTISGSYGEKYPIGSCKKLSLAEYAPAVEKASTEYAAARAAARAKLADAQAAQAARQAAARSQLAAARQTASRAQTSSQAQTASQA